MNYLNICNLLLNVDFWSALFGFIGTVLIFFFGLPPKVDLDGHINLILEQEDEKEKRKGRKYKIISFIGISLLAMSFLLQLIKILSIS
ncbi:MAG: hypothetical protein Q8N08_08730 [Methanobacteriaceae archaeon]|nr:hypothetical protein [Methanobacteriaceae archaeon]